MPHAGGVAEAQHAVVNGKVDAQDTFLAPKGARHAKRQRFVARLYGAGRPYDVLRLQRVEQRRAIDSKRCEFPHRELDENLLVLGAQHFDFGDVGHLKELAWSGCPRHGRGARDG